MTYLSFFTHSGSVVFIFTETKVYVSDMLTINLQAFIIPVKTTNLQKLSKHCRPDKVLQSVYNEVKKKTKKKQDFFSNIL